MLRGISRWTCYLIYQEFHRVDEMHPIQQNNFTYTWSQEIRFSALTTYLKLSSIFAFTLWYGHADFSTHDAELTTTLHFGIRSQAEIFIIPQIFHPLDTHSNAYWMFPFGFLFQFSSISSSCIVSFLLHNTFGLLNSLESAQENNDIIFHGFKRSEGMKDELWSKEFQRQ